MSKFLGPIHFWLYNKIIFQEEFTRFLAEFAIENNIISNKEKYIKELKPLEQAVDESNIHGYLQNQINDTEERYAKLLHELLSNKIDIFLLKKKAYSFGASHHITCETPEDAYKEFDNLFLNGMPCDKVNSITRITNDEIVWIETKNIHREVFEKLNMTTKEYYEIRISIMEGLLYNTNFNLYVNENVYSISIKKWFTMRL